jgi:hypothetical protein
VRGLALILLLVLSGCLSTPAPGCGSSSCDPKPEPVQAELAAIALEDCRGAQVTLNVPEAQARDVVGAAFVPKGDLPLVSTLLVEPLRCRRVLMPTAVVEDVGFLWVSLTVRPANASWSHARVSSYALDVLVTDEQAARVLVQAGMPAAKATFADEPLTLPGQTTDERWTFRAAGVSYELTWARPEGSGARAPAFERDFWGAPAPLSRLDVEEADILGFPVGQAPGALTVQGASVSARLLGVERTPFLAQLLDESRWTLVPSSERFEVSA